MPSRSLGPATAAFFVISLLGFSSCGGGDEEPSSTSAGSGDIVKTAQANVKALYEGTYAEPPSAAPDHETGLNIWAISAGYAGESGKRSVDGFVEAGRKLGWDVTAVDGKFDPSVQLAGVRDALVDHADGIWIALFDCAGVRAGLEEAKRADVPVVITSGLDCNETDPGAPRLATWVDGFEMPTLDGSGEIKSKQGGLLDFYRTAWGGAMAWWLIAETEGELNVIEFTETDLASTKAISEGFEEVMAQCDTCKILDNVDFLGTELGPKLQAKAQQALLQHPDANAVMGNYDSPVSTGIAAAVRASGRDVVVTGGEGLRPNIELVYAGEQAMGAGYVPEWEGYRAADDFVRIFAGEEPDPTGGFGVQVYDREHNLPPKGEPFTGPIDFVSAYEKAWGLSN